MNPLQFDTLIRRLFGLGLPKEACCVNTQQCLHAASLVRTLCPGTKDAIFLVLLVWWMNISPDEGYQVIEYFAGVARISALCHWVGYKSIAYDKDFGKAKQGKRSPMDLNSNAGLVPLDPMIA